MSTQRQQSWLGTKPNYCEYPGCATFLEHRFVDGKIRGGSWALLCTTCHREFGVGLGVGRGQLYERQNGEHFLKIKG